jgi:membrane protein
MFVLWKRAILRAVDHDALNLAQSAAYSAIIALFPALVVMAAVIAVLPDAAPVRMQLGDFLSRILPSDVSPMLTGYFAAPTGRSVRALILAALVSLSGASSVIATLMEGIRRANNLSENYWSVWRRRVRSIVLVPLTLMPVILGSVLVVFGHFMALWAAGHATELMRPAIYAMATTLRWVIAIASVVGSTALIFHVGCPLRQRWYGTLPGACIATAMWFLTTLVFGWYVTRFANYGQIYGSLGTGIALLIWLYLVFLSVLCGAEFNSEFYRHR